MTAADPFENIEKSGADALTERIKALRAEIDYHDRLYFQNSTQEISDLQYDLLVEELEKLEKRHDSKKPLHRRVPELPIGDSPTQHVGDDRTVGFQQVEHRQKMLSLAKTYSEDEVRNFHARLVKLLGTEDLHYTVEPKIDGFAVSLTFENGILVRAVTRGDGDKGDDVTANVRLAVPALPHALVNLENPPPRIIEIRGEIYLTAAEFNRINVERAEEIRVLQEERDRRRNARLASGKEVKAEVSPSLEKLYANPRNLASGTIKQLDPNAVSRRRLEIVLYSIGYCEPQIMGSQRELHQKLVAWGLPTVERIWEANDIDEAWAAIARLDKLRQSFVYGTDGAVVKLDSFEQQRLAGVIDKQPRWAIAYKFKSTTARTRLKGITIQVGKTGVLSPVAELEPVLLAGSNISRATLHNEEEIHRKDIRIGDLVEIEKAGEVIPAVLKSFPDERPDGALVFDLAAAVGRKCPVCGGEIAKVEVADQDAQGVAWKCQNYDCSAQRTGRLTFFCSRRALAIDGVGDVVAARLVELDLVRDPLDLYEITEQMLATLNLGTEDKKRTLGEPTARKIVQAREEARLLPLEKWIYSLSVPNVGESTARELGRRHSTFEELKNSMLLGAILKKAGLVAERGLQAPNSRKNPAKSKEDKQRRKEICVRLDSEIKLLEDGILAGISSEIGPVVAESVLAFFSSVPGMRLLEKMAKLRISPKGVVAARGAFTGKIFVVTGTLPNLKREEAEQKILAAGGKIAGSVSKNTSYVLAGVEAGTKLEKAIHLKVAVIDEPTLLSMLGGTVKPVDEQLNLI